jgi:putative phosphoesterase
VKIPKKDRVVIGLISDTHGLLRPEATAALAGSDLVLHAGDVGDDTVLEGLRAIAPVIAVRGNNDRAPWAFGLPETKRIAIAGARLFVLHDVSDLAFEPADRGVAAVIYGHSHKPVVERQSGVLWVNPGSAGPRRFKLPVCVARMVVENGAVRAEIVTLRIP